MYAHTVSYYKAYVNILAVLPVFELVQELFLVRVF